MKYKLLGQSNYPDRSYFYGKESGMMKYSDYHYWNGVSWEVRNFMDLPRKKKKAIKKQIRIL